LGNQGSPVILIHGLGASTEIWIHNVEVLATQHQIYVPDLVGFGRSDKPTVSYSPYYFARFVNNFINALNIERASLVGQSLGGGIALLYTLQFPDKVDKLVLVDSAGLGKEVIFTLKLMSLPIIGELMTRPSRLEVSLFFKLAVRNPVVITEDFVETYYELFSQPGAQRFLLNLVRSIVNIRGGRKEVLAPIMTNLHRITAPTLIVWGKQDRVLPLKHAHFAMERLYNSRLHILDPCGHIPNLECPDEFNKLVLEFLAGT
jgi:4,5:9,10-diseco-3-hydroxy-5,9,17-trioxoandrosta-1(10),2-diene-4-oate hydrolase